MTAHGPGTDSPLARLPDFVLRQPTGAYRSLNPTTKLTIAIAEVFVAFLGGTWSGPILALALAVGAAAVARVLRPLGLVAAITLPVVGSIMLINTFVLPGAHDAILRLGPLAPTWSGLLFGLQTTLRLLAMSLALALVYLTTEVDDLLADLERRGLGRRPAFVVGAALQTVPRTIERAAEIVDAQRARGLDTEGRFWQRARGVVPLAAPLIFGALTDVEERTVALEARAFTAPGRRTLLRRPADSAGERVARWLLLLLVGALVVGRLTRTVPSLP